MMHMEHRLTQTQRQQLVLTQKMQQALQVLQLSSLELEHMVQQELETNPFLEQVRKKEDLPDLREDGPPKEDESSFDESFDLDAFAMKWKEGQDLSRNTDLDARRQYYEDSITQEKSLRAYLLEQMAIATEDTQSYQIGERIIIGDIDERGYFTGEPALIAEELGVTEEDVLAVLDIIKRFEPTGIGARDVVECLLLQIEAEYPHESELVTLVTEHLDALMHRQIPKIAKAMKVTPERVEELKGLLSKLNPWPGHEFTSSTPQYVTPEVTVERVDDEFIVRLVNERVPEVTINETLLETLKSQKMQGDEKEYIRSKIDAARSLQRNITQRQQTILKVSQAIVEVQKEFLENGVEHIRPLTLQDIADVVGVHESTVARTTRGKYMQTPQGLFELKYFFSTGLSNDNGHTTSAKSVQALVKKIIEEEDKRKPLSDQKIADLILKESGTTVARRTVTKYREGMGIPKTSLRREY